MQKQILRSALSYGFILKLFSSLFVLALAIWLPVWFTPQTEYSAPLLARLENQSLPSRLLLAPWYRWDTAHFIEIVDDGYAANLRNTGWLPLYPALIRLVKVIFPETLLATLVVSNLAALAALYVFLQLVREEWGEALAHKSTMLLIAFPTAFILLAGYSESLFLALTVGFFLALRRKQWLAAGGLGLLAALTRFQGIVLLLPMAWEGLQAWKNLPASHKQRLPWRWAAGSALIPLGFTVFIAYTHFSLGAPLPWQGIAGWTSDRMSWPWIGFVANFVRFAELVSTGQSFIAIFFISFLSLAALLVLAATFKKMPVSYSLFALGTLCINLSHQSNADLTTPGAARYMLTIFPFFIGLALLLNNKIALNIWLIISIASQALLLTGFFWWTWNG